MVVGVKEFCFCAKGSHVAHAFVLGHRGGECVGGVGVCGLEDVATWVASVVGDLGEGAEPGDIGE